MKKIPPWGEEFGQSICARELTENAKAKLDSALESLGILLLTQFKLLNIYSAI